MGEREYGMYSKRVYGGGYTRSGRTFKKAKTSVSQSDHNKLLRLQRVVSALKPELKYAQTALTNTNIGAAGQIAYLTPVAQGTDYNQRVGNKIRCKWLHLNIEVQGWTNSTSGFYGDVFIVKDKMNQGVLPTAVGAVPAILTTGDPGTSFLNRADNDRFVVLKKFRFCSNAFGSGGVPNGVAQEYKIYLNDMPMDFETSAGAIAGASKNALFIVFITNDSGSAADFYTTSELCFSDV